ncbi:hypothetical protein L596_025292 [Steinernema carpocapsae]|uniref:Uncharacterized protein n=1 Tax=Steinernema carpocapsae TaxID=34508 RepID=A0A4U5M879_STECR|nr:hypothetical protein L596_025292 [Steinernema carpocapsae]
MDVIEDLSGTTERLLRDLDERLLRQRKVTMLQADHFWKKCVSIIENRIGLALLDILTERADTLVGLFRTFCKDNKFHFGANPTEFVLFFNKQVNVHYMTQFDEAALPLTLQSFSLLVQEVKKTIRETCCTCADTYNQWVLFDCSHTTCVPFFNKMREASFLEILHKMKLNEALEDRSGIQ